MVLPEGMYRHLFYQQRSVLIHCCRIIGSIQLLIGCQVDI